MATDTINFNPPTIKAAKISGRGGSSGSGATGGANWTSIGNSIASIGTSVAAGIATRQANIRHEKEQQLQLLKNREDLRVLQYDKVALIDKMPNTGFEDSKNKMLYGLMDDFVEIKTAMDDPNSGLDMAVAQKALIEIQQTVAKYKQQAPAVMAAAGHLKESLQKKFGTAGAIAGGVPTEQQQILLDLVEGGNVQIGAKDGSMYLYRVGEGNKVTGVFNIDEYMQVTDNGANPDAYFRTIIDITDDSKNAVAGILGDASKPMDTYYDIKRATNSSGESVITSVQWKSGNGLTTQQAKNRAIQNVGQLSFSHLTDDPKYLQEMEDLWNDTIGADSKGISGQDMVWNPNDETKRTYLVKGYVDSATGEFIFDPAGNKTQTYKDPMGNELKLTQKEFAERWFAEQAIQRFGPKVDRIESSSKASADGEGSYYDIDSAVSQLKPLISTGYFKGNQASFQLVDEGDPSTWYYAPIVTVPGQAGVYAPSQKFKINVYKTDKDGNLQKDKKGNPIIDYTGLRSGMGSKRKSQ
jgi:outer membrane lipoprotein SlyB